MRDKIGTLAYWIAALVVRRDKTPRQTDPLLCLATLMVLKYRGFG